MSRTLLVILVILVLAAGGIYALFARDLSEARARLTGHSTTIPTSFGTIEYAVAGEGEPVLAIHGAAGGFDQGLDMIGALSAHGYRVIAPSRFGYLRSAMPSNATVAMQADANAELLDKLGIQKAVVVGISAGAWSSLAFAIRHPERCRALVLLVPADYLPKGTSIHGGALVSAMFNSDFVAWAMLKLTPVMPGAMTEMMLGTDAAVINAASPEEKARVNQVLEHLLPVSARTKGMQFDVKTAATREPYALEKISCPVLAISAEDDGFGTAVRAKYIAQHVQKGEVIVYPTGGHALVGRYDAALKEVAAFLAAAK